MKSICNLMFGFTLAGLAAVLAGCGDDDSGGGASCAQVCVNIMAAKCDNDPDCMSTCKKAKDMTPMGCTDVYDALANCYASAKFTCDNQKQSVAKECSKQESAYAECLVNGGKDNGDKDAGDDGSQSGGANGGGGPVKLKDGGFGGGGGSGSGDAGGGGTNGANDCSGAMVQGACEQCIQASCCDEIITCQNDADCPTLEDCVANCNDSSCVQTCADAASASAVDLYNMVITCATDQCDSECATSGPDAGTSADVGAPNDGNTGHGATTTPPDCLFIPPDIDGYCGDVKYKVIYDCPNGPPYDDCVLNSMNSSGLYCCGH